MDSLRRKCFDCKHYIDAVAVDALGDGAIGSKFDFYHHSAAAAGCKWIAYRNTDSTGSSHDADNSVRCVIDRNRSAVVAGAAAVVAAVGCVIYLALYGR